MSRIFEALLRSEVERGGVAPAETKSAQELLKQAERQSAFQVQSASVVVAGDSLALVNGEATVQLDEGSTDRQSTSNGPTGSSGRPMSRDALLHQFQTRSVSPPADSRLVSLTQKDSPAAEAFRLLGVRMRRLGSENLRKTLLITSTTPQEGKSTIASNLACSLASGSQQNVLLIDGDLRRPALSGIFGVSAESGLCEYLRGERNLAETIYRLLEPGICLLPAGDSFGNPLELLQSSRLPTMMEALGNLFDWIIIDSPPMLPLADTSIWEKWTDGVLLVTRQGTTRKKGLERSVEAFRSQNKLIGAIINSFDAIPEEDYYYYRSGHRA